MKNIRVHIEFPGITTGELNEEFNFTDAEFEEIDPEEVADYFFYTHCHVSYTVEDVEE